MKSRNGCQFNTLVLSDANQGYPDAHQSYAQPAYTRYFFAQQEFSAKCSNRIAYGGNGHDEADVLKGKQEQQREKAAGHQADAEPHPRHANSTKENAEKIAGREVVNLANFFHSAADGKFADGTGADDDQKEKWDEWMHRFLSDLFYASNTDGALQLRLGGAWRSLANHQHTEANDHDADPASGAYRFTQGEIAGDGHHSVTDGGGGLDEAEGRPRQHQQVRNKKYRERADGQPHSARLKCANEKSRQNSWLNSGHRTKSTHTLAEQDVSQRP